MLNPTNSQQKPFWASSDPQKGLKSRVDAINRYRDSTTSADELLRFLQWVILPALLIYSATLSFSSYYTFFSNNFSPSAALVAAVLLAAVIEIGKSRMGLRAIQKPFLEGFGTIFSSPAQMLIWIGTGVFAAITFFMSVQNSTTGGKMLSQYNAQDKHREELVFQPNTEEIDRQIAESRKAIAAHSANKWKGIVMLPSQASIKAESRNIEKLQAQRESALATQRADFERRRGQIDGNIEHSSNMLMAAGGYVEAIQLIVLLIIAACQAVLAGKMEKNTVSEPKQSIGFQQRPANNMATAEAPNGPSANEDPSPARRYVGFNRDQNGQTITHTDLSERPMFPEYAPQHEAGGEILFKQIGDVFKQVVADGRTVGLLYKPNGGDWRNLGRSQVKAELATYERRAAATDASDIVKSKMKMWRWAAEQLSQDGDQA